VTPYYPIPNRKDLLFDTKAMHYFAKYWAKQGHEVAVLHMYFHTFNITNIHKYKLHFGHRIVENFLDGVRILMMENRIFHRLKIVAAMQQKLAAKRYNKILAKDTDFDVMLVHIPSFYDAFVKNLDFTGKRIAVLHMSDVKAINSGRIDADNISKFYDAIGYRSNSIKNVFDKKIDSTKCTFMVYSGAPDFYSRNESKNFFTDDTVNILYVGKLIKLKKIDVVLKALAEIEAKHNFHFTIVGNGEEEVTLKKLTYGLSLEEKVTFAGSLERQQVIEKMFESDIFVMISSPETFGLVYLEAMSQGCITIGSKGEGIDGVINDGENGFLVESGNVKELTVCLNNICDMSIEKCKELSLKAKKTASRMSEKSMAEVYLNNVIANVNK